MIHFDAVMNLKEIGSKTLINHIYALCCMVSFKLSFSLEGPNPTKN